MTDDEKIEAVAAKLTGKFYVGQRVQHTATRRTAVVLELRPQSEYVSGSVDAVFLRWDGPFNERAPDAEYACWSLEPL